MMALHEWLQQIVKGVEGGSGCILMGMDGLAIDSYYPNGVDSNFDLETLCVEYTGFLGRMRNVSQGCLVGDIQEFVVTAEQTTTIFRLLSEEFFLVLALAPSGNVGKGRYLLRTLSPKVRQELS